MTDWATGPELLISTKRMDSSYGKNAANRIEESYGDAKNLRLRHPMAALGFLFVLRSDILDTEPRIYEWLVDLLGKLGREDDAYHATCLVVVDYDDALALPEGAVDPETPLVAAGLTSDPILDAERPAVAESEVDQVMARLPAVRIRHDAVPNGLTPARFLAVLVNHVLEVTPVNLHVEARIRRQAALTEDAARSR